MKFLLILNNLIDESSKFTIEKVEVLEVVVVALLTHQHEHSLLRYVRHLPHWFASNFTDKCRMFPMSFRYFAMSTHRMKILVKVMSQE